MLQFFAHDSGEPHIETPETAGAMPFIVANILPFALLALLWVVMTYGLKVKPPTRLIVVMTYLLIAGVTMFQAAPVASIISLVVGFGLALSTMIFQAKR